MDRKADVCFVGLGYIGLPTAVAMANSGLDVVGVDVNESVVQSINAGEVTIVEPGLEEALRQALDSGKFRAVTAPERAHSFILAVPTPFGEKHEIDMKYIYSAADSIAPVLTGGELIVLESTSPPLTTNKLAERIAELRPDLVFAFNESQEQHDAVLFAHCPERILPGRALEELRTNDRIIGGMTPAATARAKEIYSSFCDGELLETNDRTAELSKLTENSYRDVNIAFANELSLICDGLGIDVWELIDLANHHPRVNILQPGPGVGGHCIAVDPWFIVSSDPDNSQLIHTARNVNDGKPEWVISKVEGMFKEDPSRKIVLLGLAFKANIDDLRESPAVSIAVQVANKFPDAQVLAVEPNIDQLPAELANLENVTLVDFEDSLTEDAVTVLLVDHKEFGASRPAVINSELLIDTRGAWR